MYGAEVTVITPISNIVENEYYNNFMLLVNLLNKQTYPDIEHLVIDNASTDGTLDLLKDYKNNGFISFFTEPDRSKYEAMNKGLRRAKGKYVSFLSCDDFYHDVTGIASVVNLMEETDADFCYFPSYCVQSPDVVFLFNPSIHNVFQVVPCPRQAMIFKKSALMQLNGFDEKFRYSADYDLMLRLVLSGFRGIQFDGNIVTCKSGTQVVLHPSQVEIEMNHIFHKNYRSICPINDAELERLVKYSELPERLMQVLSTVFPEEERDLFFQKCAAMRNFRLKALQNQRTQTQRRW